MPKMKVAQVSKPKGDFEIIEREIPSPGPGQVRIRVHACGVCHSDLYTKEGLWPGLQFPRIPGHEVAGVIDEVGSGVTTWTKGDRAGVGWHGGQDNTCPACRAGDFGDVDKGHFDMPVVVDHTTQDGFAIELERQHQCVGFIFG